MSGWLIFPSGNPVAAARQADLKILRQPFWTDGGITTEAVPVIAHPTNGQSAIFVGPEAEPLLTVGEQAQLRDRDFMISAGWFG